MDKVICVDGREAPDTLADFVREMEFHIQRDPALSSWKSNKKVWWSYVKSNHGVVEAYQDVVDSATMQGRLPLPPSTAYDLVRSKGYKFTRDYSPFFARLMNKMYGGRVFKIKQQVGEPDSVFEKLVDPQ